MRGVRGVGDSEWRMSCQVEVAEEDVPQEATKLHRRVFAKWFRPGAKGYGKVPVLLASCSNLRGLHVKRNWHEPKWPYV